MNACVCVCVCVSVCVCVCVCVWCVCVCVYKYINVCDIKLYHDHAVKNESLINIG